MVTTAGAETLPFLASCVVLPASLAFFMLYNKLVEALPSVGGTGTCFGLVGRRVRVAPEPALASWRGSGVEGQGGACRAGQGRAVHVWDLRNKTPSPLSVASTSPSCPPLLPPLPACRSMCSTLPCRPWWPSTFYSPWCSTPCTAPCISTASTPPLRPWCPMDCTACSRVGAGGGEGRGGGWGLGSGAACSCVPQNTGVCVATSLGFACQQLPPPTHPPTRPLAPPPACLCHVLPPPCSD
jgi:hypothetical protein